MAKGQKKVSEISPREFLIRCAKERQMLGLSATEYDALTPAELDIELSAYYELVREKLEIKSQTLKILDFALARIALLLNGYKFPDFKNVEDFKIFKTPQKNMRSQTANFKKNMGMAFRAKATRERVLAELARVKKEREKTDGS